jgi:hypothetical protein
VQSRAGSFTARNLWLPAALIFASRAMAGGGVVLQDDACIITIGFYTAHFTAYQPETNGNREFCEDLPDTGETIFVLDYLHSSLKDVPVSFRIIRDASDLGRFVKWEDVQKLGDLEPHTVFFQAPVVEPSASFRVSMDFSQKGDYVGIATAAHPGNDNIYVAVFPFRVGAADFPFAIVTFLLAIVVVAVYLVRLGKIGKTGAESTR